MRRASFNYITVLALAGMLLGAGPATQPAGKKRPAGAERTVHAMVVGVEGRALKISMLKKKAEVKERRVRVAKTAVVTLNQQPVALSALKAGENVTIKISHGVATHVDATGR
jgi:hypothetical protein